MPRTSLAFYNAAMSVVKLATRGFTQTVCAVNTPAVRPTNAVAYRREGGGSATGAVEGCRRTGRGLGEDRLQRGQRLSAHPTSHSTEGRGGDRPARLPAEFGGSDSGSRSVGRRG